MESKTKVDPGKPVRIMWKRHPHGYLYTARKGGLRVAKIYGKPNGTYEYFVEFGDQKDSHFVHESKLMDEEEAMIKAERELLR